MTAEQQRAPDLPDREVEGVGVEQRPDVRLVEAELRLGRRHQAGDVAVADDAALGLAGRAGGVDDVGRLLGRQRQAERGGGFGGRQRLGLGQIDHGQRAVAQRRRQGGTGGGMGQHQRQAAVLGQPGQAVGGIGGVERDVAAAGLEDGEQADDQARRRVPGTILPAFRR